MFRSRLLARFSPASLLCAAGVALAGLLPLPALATLTVSATATTDPFYPGESKVINIDFSNDVTTPITGMTFTSSLMGGDASNGPIIVSGAFNCAGTLTAVAGTKLVELSGVTIPASNNGTAGTCRIELTVTAKTSTGAGANYSYQFASGAASGTQNAAPVQSSGAGNQGISVLALSRPSISKTFVANTLVLGGAPTQLRITVANPNPVELADFSITDAFPVANGDAIIKVAQTPSASASCTGSGGSAAFAPAPASGDVSVTGTGTLPASGSCTLIVNVDAKHTNNEYSYTQNNTINGSTQFSTGIGLSASGNVSVPVTVRSPLRVEKTFNANSLSSGQNANFTITFHNDGGVPLGINSFSDSPIDDAAGNATLTQGLYVTGATDNSCGSGVGLTHTTEGITMAGGTIPANGSCSVTVDFKGSVQTNGVPVTYTNTLPKGAVNVNVAGIVSELASDSILVADDLRVLKTSSPSVVVPGNPVQYRITVENYGQFPINNVVVTDTFTHGQAYLTGTPAGNTIVYTPEIEGTGCGVLTELSLAGINPAKFGISTIPGRANILDEPGKCTIVMWAMSSLDENETSTANTIVQNGVCYNNGGGQVCNGGPVLNPPNGMNNAVVLSAVKEFAKNSGNVSQFPEGTIVRMTVTLTNRSANTLTNVSISDTLNAGSTGGQLRVATPSNIASTCGSPTFVAAPGSTSIQMNGGTVPARTYSPDTNGTCVLQVDVVGPAGQYTNIATVAGTQTYGNGTTATVGPIDTAVADLIYDPVLTATKAFSPGSVSAGGKSTVTVRLFNSSGLVLTNASVTDPLPAGMVLANPVNAYTTCAGNTKITTGASQIASPGTPVSVAGDPAPVAGGTSIALAGATVAGNGNCAFLFDVVATGGANWINNIPVNHVTADGGIRNTAPVSATLTRNPSSGISITKGTSKGGVVTGDLGFPGEVAQLELRIRNNSAQAVTNLTVTDFFTLDGTENALPNGWQITATPSATTTCEKGVVNAVPSGRFVKLSGASLAATPAECVVMVNVTSTASGTVTNFIPPNSIKTDQGLTNDSVATTTLAAAKQVGMVKKFTPNVIKPGERSRLRITIVNPTPQPVSDLSVIDTLPVAPSVMTVPAGANPTSTCGGTVTSSIVGGAHQVRLSGGILAGADGAGPKNCQIEIDVLVSATGDYVNTIPAINLTGTSGGVVLVPNQPTTDTLQARAPLTVHKAFSSLTLDPGNPGFTTGIDNKAPGAVSVLTLRFENSNATALTGLNVIDALPAGLVVEPVIPSTPSTTCAGGIVVAAPSATSIRLTGATIPAKAGATNGFCTVTVNVLSNIPGTYTNSIPAGDVKTDQGIVNEVPTSAQLIVSKPPTVGKQFAPPVIQAGGTSILSIVIGNDNSTVMTLTANFDDVLPTAPGPIVLAAGTPLLSSSTCPPSTLSSVVATAGAASVRINNGATIPAGGCTIDVSVTGSVPGVHTNNIPAGALKTNFGTNPDPANAPLTINTLGYISGKVFKDNAMPSNGVFESGDAPIAGVAIELRSGSSCSNPLVVFPPGGSANPATTDALGNYIFTNLALGTYSVCEPVQPAGTDNGATKAGPITNINGSTGTAGTASSQTSTPSQITGITFTGLGLGNEISGSTNNNFAEIGRSSVSGTVFKDLDNDGVRNGADAPLAGVEIRLTGTDINGVPVNLSTTTDANGNYVFDNVVAGTYSIVEPTQPANTSNGITTAGKLPNGSTVGTATGVATPISAINTIVLPPNTVSSNNNFAELLNSRSISGMVFLDFPSGVAGVFDSIDHGIGGQVINLTGTDINGVTVTRSTTTTADGRYRFSDLPEGTYTVAQPGPQPVGTTNGLTIKDVNMPGSVITPVPGSLSSISVIAMTGATMVSPDNNFAEITGASPDLAIAKTHSPASFAEGSTTGFYTIKVTNIGVVATSGTTTMVDTLPAGLTPLAVSGGAMWVCSKTATQVTCNTNAILAANGGAASDITVRVAVGTGTAGTILNNIAKVSGGGEQPGFEGNNTAIDPTAVAQAAALSGHVWLDLNHDRTKNDVSPVSLIKGWRVELMLNGTVVDTTVTDDAGAYSFPNVIPNQGYQVRFRHPTTGMIFGSAVPNEGGVSFNNTNGTPAPENPTGAKVTDGTLSEMQLLAGKSYPQQSLPIDPAGVVYDAVSRLPVGGAVVTISGPGGFNAATDLVGGNANFVTGADGLYQFLLNPTAPSGTYTLKITTYPGGYLPLPSTLIPGCSSKLDVAPSATPALVQNNTLPPAAGAPLHNPAACPGISSGLGVGAGTTQFYYSFEIHANSANVINNHIPLDPVLGGAIVMTKSTPLVNVVRGDLVPYTITATNTLNATLGKINVVDTIPAGFRYRTGSASLNGVATEPVVTGRNLTWANQTFTAGERKTWRMLMVVGAGVSEGEYVNQVAARNTLANAQVSNTATATVRVVPDPTFDCSDIIGKVFDDKNANGYQDQDEPGIANVRVATARGLLVTSDHEGRFHVACAAIPNADRGSNFVMKLDERTLPSGYRITTENPRDVRVTRGKMVKLNFGATVHRVIRLDISGTAFNGDSTELQASYLSELEKLPEQLQARPSVLRIAYRRGAESADLAKKRIDAVSERIQSLWHAKRHKEDEESEPLVPLMIETEMEAAQ